MIIDNETKTLLALEQSLPRQIAKAEFVIAKLKSIPSKTAEQLADLQEIESGLVHLNDKRLRVISQLNVIEKRYIAESTMCVISDNKRGCEVVVIHTDPQGRKTSITRHLTGNQGWSPFKRQIMSYLFVSKVLPRAA